MNEIRDDGMPRGKPFKKGEGGRPRGARNKLGEEFLEALYADFQDHGVDAIARVREEKPDAYLKVVASLLPRDLNLRVNPLEALSDEELNQRIRVLGKQILPLLDLSSDDEVLN